MPEERMKEPKTRILLVEDEKNLAEGLAYNLRSEGHDTVIARDGREALQLFDEGPWTLIILDLMLPYVDGIEVAQRIREKDLQVPILMLTARGKEEDRIEGLASGADDYLTKPFHLTELLLRVQGMIRRKNSYREIPPAGSLYRFGADCWVDFARHSAKGPAGERGLTDIETRILKLLLVEHKKWRHGSRCWRRSGVTQKRLRPAPLIILSDASGPIFEPDPSNPRHIVSVRGLGYRFKR